MISGVGHWRMSEPATKLPGEMSIVAKAAGVGDLADGLARVQQPPAMQLTRGMIQTDRVYQQWWDLLVGSARDAGRRMLRQR